MKKGFTMIELVFVIVIIGILSAIAIPKFFETSTQAHNAVVKAFMGNLNRNVEPMIFAHDEARARGDHSRRGCSQSIYEEYTDIPKEIEMRGSNCIFTPVTGNGATISLSMGLFADAGERSSGEIMSWSVIP